ncbi:MAG: hypothetical protein ABEJ36_04765 [Candidatus Nanosalina sp.]
MEAESVIFGKWDNHGKEGNLRLSSQDSQKVDEDVELVSKHGNKHISDVADVQALKNVLKYTAMREVEGFDMEKACRAVKLFNEYYSFEIDPEEAISGWKLDRKIKS